MRTHERTKIPGMGLTGRQDPAADEEHPDGLPTGGSSPHEDPYVSRLLEGSAQLYRARNAVYKDNYRRVGKVMHALFPDGPPPLDGPSDYNRWHLFELAIVKLTRYAVAYEQGVAHKDSLEDMIVYLAMVAGCDAEQGLYDDDPDLPSGYSEKV